MGEHWVTMHVVRKEKGKVIGGERGGWLVQTGSVNRQIDR